MLLKILPDRPLQSPALLMITPMIGENC
jgi:hypothetical protein